MKSIRDPFDSPMGPECFGGEDYTSYTKEVSKEVAANYPPIATPEQMTAIKEAYKLFTGSKYTQGKGFDSGFDPDAPWIQTYSGRRFCPTNPNSDAIVIQDIAHALSNICRYTGHSFEFFSVAQHSVLVSYLCNYENALYGLLHDASEAYCQDIASPIKRSVEFTSYRELEKKIQNAVCKRFSLPEKEPEDVKRADMLMLATESRDLMAPLHPDWKLDIIPAPFKIVPLAPKEAKKLFMDRFLALTNT